MIKILGKQVIFIENFLRRPKPIQKENLTSYISRVAEENYVSPHELWRLLLPPKAHYPQTSISMMIDICPASTFDYIRFEEMLGIKHIEHLTFLPVFRKIGIEEIAIPKSQVLGGMLENHRNYCPECLKEKKAYMKIWQIREVNWCDIHQVKLVTECWYCHKNIPLLPSSGLTCKCPFCNSNLSLAHTHSVNVGLKESRVLNDWKYILNPEKQGLPLLTELSYQQHMAMRILFASEVSSICYTARKEKLPSSIMQSARKSRVNESFTHLGLILSVIRDLEISLDDFFNLKIPESFISKILTKPTTIIQRTSCLAPWCKGYLNPGSLRRTATSTKVRKDGSKQNYYMICTNCGNEYCLAGSGREIQERGYFISLAYKKVLPQLHKTMSIKQMAKELGVTEDLIKRSIIYLAANGLIIEGELPLAIPCEHDEGIIQEILKEIREGTLSKKIRVKLGMKYNDFLFYWFETRIRKASLLYKPIERAERKVPRTENLSRVRATLAYCQANNIKITINGVAKILEVCPETIRLWGLLSVIKEAKEVQKLTANLKIEQELIMQAEEIIRFNSSMGRLISSELVYDQLGHPRSSMWRDHPAVAKCIAQLVKKNN